MNAALGTGTNLSVASGTTATVTSAGSVAGTVTANGTLGGVGSVGGTTVTNTGTLAQTNNAASGAMTLSSLALNAGSTISLLSNTSLSTTADAFNVGGGTLNLQADSTGSKINISGTSGLAAGNYELFSYNTLQDNGSTTSGNLTPDFNVTNPAGKTITVVGSGGHVYLDVANNNHPIISLTTAAPSGYGSSVGPTLTVTGSSGSYTLAQDTGISATTGYVEAAGFNPSSDTEQYALDVLIGGVQASPSQLAQLVADINSSSTGYGFGAAIASTTSTSGSFPAVQFVPDVIPSQPAQRRIDPHRQLFRVRPDEHERPQPGRQPDRLRRGGGARAD